MPSSRNAERDAKISRAMARQHGLITDAQLWAWKLSRPAKARRVASGVWVAMHPGVTRSAAHPATDDCRLLAAALSTKGIVSHRSAAALWGVPGHSAKRRELTVPRGRHLHLPGVVIHETTQWRFVDRHAVRAIPVTGPGRTLLDLAAVVGTKKLWRATDEFLRRELVSWESLYAVLVRHARCGRNGTVAFRAMLDERVGTEQIALSDWSENVADLLVDAGLPRPEVEHRIQTRSGRFVAQVDLAYPDVRLCIELDSKAWHMDHESFIRDPRRRNRVLNLGWRVLTFTWDDYVNQPGQLCDTVDTAFRSLSAA